MRLNRLHGHLAVTSLHHHCIFLGSKLIYNGHKTMKEAWEDEWKPPVMTSNPHTDILPNDVTMRLQCDCSHTAVPLLRSITAA